MLYLFHLLNVARHSICSFIYVYICIYLYICIYIYHTLVLNQFVCLLAVCAHFVQVVPVCVYIYIHTRVYMNIFVSGAWCYRIVVVIFIDSFPKRIKAFNCQFPTIYRLFSHKHFSSQTHWKLFKLPSGSGRRGVVTLQQSSCCILLLFLPICSATKGFIESISCLKAIREHNK